MLYDTFGRKIEYLRLSVTDRCDFRCFYCLPKGYKGFSPPDSWLAVEEIERLMRVFSELGIDKVRITGGEPLVRKDLPEIVRRIGRLPKIQDLSLSTNASQLARHAQSLKANGVSRINVSLDTLNRARFRDITQGDLDQVLAGLMAAKDTGLHPIKINMVVMKGINDHEITDMVQFCLKHDFTLRFIETMPVGVTGKGATDRFLSLHQVREQLESVYQLEPAAMRGAGPASYVRVKDTRLRIGFITPLSQHFCETCNRVRLSVEGTLYLCLGKHDNMEFRPLLRKGISDELLKEKVLEAIARKPERHEFREKPGEIVRVMALTGG
ncbi:MAG: GTP 3',8-cyclase MoaA [Gammaproteobacteria bacterium]|nr:GTP 3',8-cyclase MoaA [Gammaproteobacteria bacterium]